MPTTRPLPALSANLLAPPSARSMGTAKALRQTGRDGPASGAVGCASGSAEIIRARLPSSVISFGGGRLSPRGERQRPTTRTERQRPLGGKVLAPLAVEGDRPGRGRMTAVGLRSRPACELVQQPEVWAKTPLRFGGSSQPGHRPIANLAGQTDNTFEHLPSAQIGSGRTEPCPGGRGFRGELPRTVPSRPVILKGPSRDVDNGTMVRYRWRRASAFQKFALVTAVVLVVFGVMLGVAAALFARGHSLREAEKRVDGLTSALLAGHLEHVEQELSSSQTRSLRRTLEPAFADDELAGIRVLSPRGNIVYAQGLRPDSAIRGGSHFRSAMAGRGSSEVISLVPSSTRKGTGRKGGPKKLVAAYFPLRARSSGRPSAVIEAYVSHERVAAAAASLRFRLWLAIAVGLALLCGALLGLLRRVGEQLQSQADEREHQALHDPLTGLGNRGLFNQVAEQALAERQGDELMALVVMDLDRFKAINDGLGHFNGDLVIQRASQRICEVMREDDFVARLGGDEFAVFLPQVTSKEALMQVIERLQTSFKEPFVVSGLALEVDVSIGAALCPEHGTDVAELLQAADVAMYAAKGEHSGWKVYTRDQHRNTPAQLSLVAELRRALDTDELVFHYQPKAALSTGAVEGVEALVRWQHRHRGMLYPDKFIPLAERTSLVRPLTLNLIERALVQMSEWDKAGLELNMAVNLSAQMLLDNDLPGDLGEMLFRHGVPARRLELEVTESSIMLDPRRAAALLHALSEIGIAIAIDDFGTGYSSLVSLKQLPVSTLKVDKSFVIEMGDDEKDAVIARSTIALGKSLGLQVVAEGVESRASWSQLTAWGCDYAQGYFLSKALPPAEFANWLSAYRGLGLGSALVESRAASAG